VAATLSLCHQFAEEWYRALVSLWFQLRGRVVLWDRHFLFEHAIPEEEARRNPPRLTERVHLWLLRHAYPAPDLTIFLDAPVEILQQRKKEQTVARLRRHRDAVLETGRQLKNFQQVDATRTIDEVYADVERRILACCE
jgi:thymidylate kinase